MIFKKHNKNHENFKVKETKNDETAFMLDWEAKWDIGAPCPHVISSGLKTFLIYYAEESDNVENTQVALVEFIDCYSSKFGGADDEVISGHILWEKGLKYYSAHEIFNSHWIEEEMKTNSIHPHFNKDRWKERKHYMLLFHDEIFECIASGYKIEVFQENLLNVFQEAQRRLFE
jgi:hypothetical protein